MVAWNPWNESDIQALENVQKCLVRVLLDVRGKLTRRECVTQD